ncbi:MAG: hypothetical protein ACC619_03450, partial [Paracoccaceae bacterium]
ASFEPFEQRHLEFLSSIEENACVSLRAAQNQVELRQLLAQTKQQAIFFRVFKDATDPIVLEDLSGDVLDLNAAAFAAGGQGVQIRLAATFWRRLSSVNSRPTTEL